MTSGSPSSSGLKYRDESKIIFEIPGIRQLSTKLFKGFHFSITGATVNLIERKITFHSCLEDSHWYYYLSNSPKYKYTVADFVNGVGTRHFILDSSQKSLPLDRSICLCNMHVWRPVIHTIWIRFSLIIPGTHYFSTTMYILFFFSIYFIEKIDWT